MDHVSEASEHCPRTLHQHHAGLGARGHGQQVPDPGVALRSGGFIARDPEGVRILTADIGVRTDKKTGKRVGAMERLREQSTEPGFPRGISVYQAKNCVKHYDLERDGNGAPYFFIDRPHPGTGEDV